MKISYAYYIFLDKFPSIVRFGVASSAGKLGGLQHIVARLMLATLKYIHNGCQIINQSLIKKE